MKDNTTGRAIGAVGPGDMRKLAGAGLTVVDTRAYEQMRARLRTAEEVIRRAQPWGAHDDTLRDALRAWEEARHGDV